jgi:ferredoxin
VSSLVSPREIGVREPAVCKSCRTHDCIRGNEHARGCELYLFQPKKAGNLDCTFCLDCVKACPHDNVGLVSIAPAHTLTADPYRSSIGRLSRRTDFAAVAAVVVFGAFVNAAGMVAPVLMREHMWHARLGPHAMPLIIGCFVVAGVIVVPAAALAICAGLNRWSGTRANVFDVMRRFVFALVPVGAAMWAAHLLYHLVTGWSAPAAAIGRWFASGTSSLPAAVVPGWLTGAEILVLDAGLLLTLYVCWRVANQYAGRLREAVAVMAPWATVSIALYAVGVWILFQPMQMRGMMH